MAVIEAGNLLVVVDAGPIIHLDELDALDALRGFDKVLVTQTVWEEISRHRSPDLASFPIRRVPDPETDALVEGLSKTFSLHAGEKSALNFARQVPDAIFATDDTAARLAGN